MARTIYNDRGLKRRCIVSSLTMHHAKYVYEQIYARRGRINHQNTLSNPKFFPTKSKSRQNHGSRSSRLSASPPLYYSRA
ncbi:MAG: hypothetical protein IT342_24715 [Candidatus Melainabacteria bacterium]|nr:hypothetical protein [Candidatus Melainabacteria bacterium]